VNRSRMTDPCPSEDDLLALSEGRLRGPAAVPLLQHAGDCDVCRMLVAFLCEKPNAPRPPRKGESFARYTMLEPLGAGPAAAGVVWAAYDPKLERKVALKLLRPEVLAQNPDVEARLGREAQALARLQHPNVVRVYDVGTEGDRLYVSMELIEGVTLSEWMRA